MNYMQYLQNLIQNVMMYRPLLKSCEIQECAAAVSAVNYGAYINDIIFERE